MQSATQRALFQLTPSSCISNDGAQISDAKLTLNQVENTFIFLPYFKVNMIVELELFNYPQWALEIFI